VTGQVTNGTTGAAVPADLPITLHVLSGMEETGTYTTTVAADGSFRFDGLVVGQEQAVVAETTYQDATYFSEPDWLAAAEGELSLPLVIYETTADPADILVTQLHIFIRRLGDSPHRLECGEVYLLSNTGERTYVGAPDAASGRRATLDFTLPEGAENLRFDGPGLGERFLERPGGFADTMPIPPGVATVSVLLSYELPYRPGLQLEWTFAAPIASVVIVLPGPGLALDGAGLTSAGTIDTQMGTALSYTAGPLAAGQTLAIALVEDASAAPAAAAVSSRPQDVALGLAALAAAVLAAYRLWRSPAPPMPAQVRPIVDAIAALDDDFEAGRIAEETYHRERAVRLQQAQALLEENAGDRDP